VLALVLHSIRIDLNMLWRTILLHTGAHVPSIALLAGAPAWTYAMQAGCRQRGATSACHESSQYRYAALSTHHEVWQRSPAQGASAIVAAIVAACTALNFRGLDDVVS
jgi:hypothetical protein